MAEIPRISGSEAVRAFVRAGFVDTRTKGSHHILEKDGLRKHLSIPVHAGKTIGKSLLRSLIRASGLTVEEFRELL